MYKTRSRRVCALTAFVLTTAASVAHACESDAQCKGDRICLDGSCQPAPARSCTTDVECPLDQICQASVCVAQAPAPPAPVATAQPAAAVVPASQTVVVAPQPSEPVETETRGILGLTIAGPITMGAAWLATISTTAALGAPGEVIGYASIPVLGPWIMLGATEGGGDYGGAMAASGVIQAAGLTMLILGLSIRREVPITTAGGGSSLALELAPVVSHDTSAMVLSATW